MLCKSSLTKASYAMVRESLEEAQNTPLRSINNILLIYLLFVSNVGVPPGQMVENKKFDQLVMYL